MQINLTVKKNNQIVFQDRWKQEDNTIAEEVAIKLTEWEASLEDFDLDEYLASLPDINEEE